MTPYTLVQNNDDTILVQTIKSLEKKASDLEHQLGQIRSTLFVNYATEHHRHTDGISVNTDGRDTLDVMVDVLKAYHYKCTAPYITPTPDPAQPVPEL